MARADIMSILYSKNKSPLDFNFDSLVAPPLLSFFTPDDIYSLYKIATSLKLSSKIKEKYRLIDEIMVRRGFRKLGCGTNRIVYACLENPNIVAKIALDRVGISDNPAEYQNQFYIKPFCTKVFDVSPCGTIAITERVQPITSKAEFLSVAEDIFEFLNSCIIGEYVIEDIGTKYFMNFGLRDNGFGIVLLDYPYLYPLDGNKLYCTALLPNSNIVCNSVIDYDSGFNSLICTGCGKRYYAKDLKKENSTISINKEGDDDMIVEIRQGDKVIKVGNETETIKTPKECEDSCIGDVVLATRNNKNTGYVPQAKKLEVSKPKGLSIEEFNKKNGDRIEKSTINHTIEISMSDDKPPVINPDMEKLKDFVPDGLTVVDSLEEVEIKEEPEEVSINEVLEQISPREESEESIFTEEEKLLTAEEMYEKESAIDEPTVLESIPKSQVDEMLKRYGLSESDFEEPEEESEGDPEKEEPEKKKVNPKDLY